MAKPPQKPACKGLGRAMDGVFSALGHATDGISTNITH